MDTNKDLIKLYHPSGQNPKEVAAVCDVVIEALYQLGLPAGTFSVVYRKYNYKLPPSIVVIGSNDHRYRYKGTGVIIDPVSDTYDPLTGVGSNWVDIDVALGCG